VFQQENAGFFCSVQISNSRQKSFELLQNLGLGLKRQTKPKEIVYKPKGSKKHDSYHLQYPM
jgi:hypothetical protein